MASAKAKIRHVFGDTFSCRAAPPDILVELSELYPSDVKSAMFLGTPGRCKTRAGKRGDIALIHV